MCSGGGLGRTSEQGQAWGLPAGVTTGVIQWWGPLRFRSHRSSHASVPSSLSSLSRVLSCTCSPAGQGDLLACRPPAWVLVLWNKTLSLIPDSAKGYPKRDVLALTLDLHLVQAGPPLTPEREGRRTQPSPSTCRAPFHSGVAGLGALADSTGLPRAQPATGRSREYR